MTDMADPLCILHIVRPAAGGMKRHIVLLCAGLSTRGFDLTVAAPPAFVQSSCPPVLLSTCHLVSVPISSHPHMAHDLRAVAAVARCARKADLLHGHGLRGAWIAAIAARLARKPFVYTAHNLAPANPSGITRNLFVMAASRAAAVICVSRAVADSLSSYGVKQSSIVLIPNGVDLPPFDAPGDPAAISAIMGREARGKRPEADTLSTPHSALRTPHSALRTVILAVGRLAREKGFDVLIKAAPRILETYPAATLILAGEGEERGRLEGIVREKGLGERFLLPGYCADIAALMAAADIVVVPSRSEGQGFVALEAMAARKPVVASRVGGLAETVENGVTGLLVPPDEPGKLANAIVRLLNDKLMQVRMGQSGRERVERYYTVNRMVDRTAELYREAFAKSQRKVL